MSEWLASRSTRHRDILLIVLASSVLFILALGARDLWNPNEPIYGLAVTEMAQRGDPLIPTVNGVPFAEKPVLYYWAALLASEILGRVDEFSLRLPLALSAVLAAVLLYLLVYPYAGLERARIAVAVFATTYSVFWAARTIQMDGMVLTATLAVVLAVTRVVDFDASAWRGWSWAGLAAGLGFLAKGPVAWICPAAVLVAYLALTGRLRRLWHPAVALGALVCLATVAPWILWLATSGETAFLDEALLRQNFSRFVDAWDHQQPWWYYGLYFWIDMAPWGWFVPLAWALPARDEGGRRLDLLAWCWILGVVLFFSFSASKRSAYILPVAPAAAMLVSVVAQRMFHGTLGKWRTRAALALCSLGGTAALVGGAMVYTRILGRYPEFGAAGQALSLLLIAGGVAILSSLFLKRRNVAAPTAWFALMATFYLLAATAVLPAANAIKSARPFCDQVIARAGVAGELRGYLTWVWRAEYPFYLRRALPVLRSQEQLASYWSRPGEVFLIIEDERLDGVEGARTVIGDRPPLIDHPIGHKQVYLFSNRNPAIPESSTTAER